MIGVQLTATDKLGDEDIHSPILQKKPKKVREDSIVRLVGMGYSEQEAEKLVEA